MSAVAQRLKAERNKKGLTQKQVSDFTGIHYKTLSGYENAVSEPDLDTLTTLAKLYAVSTDYLLGNDDVATQVAADSLKVQPASYCLEHILEMNNLTFNGALLTADDKERIKRTLELVLWNSNKTNPQ